MTECGDYLLLNEDFTTTGAFLAFCQPCNNTSGSLFFKNDNIPSIMTVRQFGYLHSFVCSAVNTIAALFAHLSFSGSLGLAPSSVVVLSCRYYGLCFEYFITYRAMFAFGQTGFGTSGRYCGINGFGVSKRVQSLRFHLTACTGARLLALLGASGLLCSRPIAKGVNVCFCFRRGSVLFRRRVIRGWIIAIITCHKKQHERKKQCQNQKYRFFHFLLQNQKTQLSINDILTIIILLLENCVITIIIQI